MDFTSQINADIKAAMLAKDKVKLEALRAIKKELIEVKSAKGASDEISDEQVAKILQKMVKQRKDSADLFKEQGREDLAEVELLQVAAIEPYLPEQLSDDELGTIVKTIIEQVGASSMKDMGKVMGLASKQLAGKAEGKAISDKVKSLLS